MASPPKAPQPSHTQGNGSAHSLAHSPASLPPTSPRSPSLGPQTALTRGRSLSFDLTRPMARSPSFSAVRDEVGNSIDAAVVYMRRKRALGPMLLDRLEATIGALRRSGMDDLSVRPLQGNSSAYLHHVETLFLLRAVAVEGSDITNDVERTVRAAMEVTTARPTQASPATTSTIRLVESLAKDLDRALFPAQPSGDGPVLLQVASAAGLGREEAAALAFVCLVHLGGQFPVFTKGFIKRGTVRNMQLYTHMSPAQVLRFLGRMETEGSLFGLIELNDTLSTDLSDVSLMMPRAALLALVGEELSADEALMVDSTVLVGIVKEKVEGPGEEGKRARWDKDGGELTGDEAQQLKKMLGDWKDDPEEDAFAAMEDIRESLPTTAGDADGGGDASTAYSCDLDYLGDAWELLVTRVKMRELERGDDSTRMITLKEKSTENMLRELKAKERYAEARWDERTRLTHEASDETGWLPRLEVLAKRLGLERFEKLVVIALVGKVIHPKMSEQRGYGRYGVELSVGGVLELLCGDIREQVERRRHFYKDARLVKNGLVRLNRPRLAAHNGDLTLWEASVDRRLLDFLLGLDTEFSELIDGGNLIMPTVRMEQIVLGDGVKSLILNTIGNHTRCQRLQNKFGLRDVVAYGRGLVILFFGPPGTGKTMTANGIASHFGKKLLLVNFSLAASGNAVGDVLQLVFREAKLQDAIVFFDECEGLLQSRDRPGHSDALPIVLSEIERYDGVLLFATNRPEDIDEAMHRRISLAVEFPVPEPAGREAIWRTHLPPAMNLSPDVDIQRVARDFRMAGGYIKNALLAALSFAVARAEGGQDEDVVVRHDDLIRACTLQVRDRLGADSGGDQNGGARTQGLARLSSTLRPETYTMLQDIAAFEQGRRQLMDTYGFGMERGYGKGTVCFFHGPVGTGKSSSAAGIAAELGREVVATSCVVLMNRPVRAMRRHFTEAQNGRKVVILRDVEQVASTSLGRRPKALSDAWFVLLECVEEYMGVVIFIVAEERVVDPALVQKARFVVTFQPPGTEERARMWELAVPSKVDCADDVNFTTLAKRYQEFCGANIRNAVILAASASLQGVSEGGARVTMDTLDAAAKKERARVAGMEGLSSRNAVSSLYS